MRNIAIYSCTIAVATYWATFCLGTGAFLSAAAVRPTAVLSHVNNLAFNAIELAKIFGRLADPSPIGSVLKTPNCNVVGVDTRRKCKWRSLFDHEDESLSRPQFSKRLAAAQLDWPTYYVANRQPLFLVPERQRHKFKLKGYLGNDDAKEGAAAISGRALKGIATQPLEEEAVDSVFMALSHEEDKLTINHILAFIRYRSPLLRMVNWETFLASLPVGPDDIPI
ncbi:phosphopentomutase [Babesia ovata]|uniref:Phosphopentomutase n=1 Tax=Babesia ovata TaxID=189622 RepID=A0A2H6KHJ7_9APIC|nr:phosphopentomutase [Babesia ovata]GBE62465.1 phosphopentomutase [Babesia ovata]